MPNMLPRLANTTITVLPWPSSSSGLISSSPARNRPPSIAQKKMQRTTALYLKMFIFHSPEAQSWKWGWAERERMPKMRPAQVLVTTELSAAIIRLRYCSSIVFPHFSLQLAIHTLASCLCDFCFDSFIQYPASVSRCMAASPARIRRVLEVLLPRSCRWMSCLSPPCEYRRERAIPIYNPSITWSRLCPPRYSREVETAPISSTATTPQTFWRFLSTRSSRITHATTAANSACPLGLPKSLGQQQPMFLTAWAVQQGRGAAKKALRTVVRQELKSMKRTVVQASNLRRMTSSMRMTQAVTKSGSMMKVKKMKKASRAGEEWLCICRISLTPKAYSWWPHSQLASTSRGSPAAAAQKASRCSIN